MDALALERAHLIGNSLGGRVAIELGMSHPERVGAAGAAVPGAGVATGAAAGAADAAHPARAGARADRPPAARGGDRAAGDPGRRGRLDGGRRGRVPAGLPDPGGPGRLLRGGPPHLPRRARTGRGASGHGWPSCRPSRCSSGASATGSCRSPSPATSSRCSREARHLELDCGHVPQIERPRRTHRAIREFLGAPGRRAIDE